MGNISKEHTLPVAQAREGVIGIEQHNLDSVAHRSRQPVNRSISQNKLLQEKRNLARVLTNKRRKKETWIPEPVDAATWRVLLALDSSRLSSSEGTTRGWPTDGKKEEVAAAVAAAVVVRERRRLRLQFRSTEGPV